MARKRKVTVSRTTRAVPARGLRPAKMVRSGELRLEGIDPKKLRRIRVQNRIRATTTGTRTFDRSLHKTNIWLKQVMQAMDWDNRERAYSAMRATLHALRDVLVIEELVKLGAQLPILLRGVFYEGFSPHHTPMRLKNLDEFHALVRRHLGPSSAKFGNEDIRRFVTACLGVIGKHVTAGELREVRAVLPERLKELIELGVMVKVAKIAKAARARRAA